MKCRQGHRLTYLEDLGWVHPDPTAWCSADVDIDPEPVGPYAPTRTSGEVIVHSTERLLAQFADLPTHRWVDDRVVKVLGTRLDGLVDVVLGIGRQMTDNRVWAGERFDVLTEVVERLCQIVAPAGIDQPVIVAIKKAEYDRGVAAGREQRSDAHKSGFDAGRAIGQSEAEAELLDQGWTPPGAVHTLEVRTGPTDYEVWRDAHQLAVTERNYIDADRNLNDTWLTARVERFWERLQDVPVLKNDGTVPLGDEEVELVWDRKDPETR